MPDEVIINKIYFIRGQKVMLDKDLAGLYAVTTGNLNKAVMRNQKRFPDDFMFRLTVDEYRDLIFHFGISSWGGTRKMPFVFTEQGVAMLSGVLNSGVAIEVNIRIIRIFTKLREMLLTHKDTVLRGRTPVVPETYRTGRRILYRGIDLYIFMKLAFVWCGRGKGYNYVCKLLQNRLAQPDPQ